MGIALAILFLLPFPFDLILLFGIIFLIQFFRRRRFIQRYGSQGGIKGLFGMFSSSSPSGNLHKPLRYYCMSCGKEHNDKACPICGSKMKRVG
ncbi:MAG: hypothetical protein ACR2IS_13050 [Nitrososphaeraceae archaeon]